MKKDFDRRNFIKTSVLATAGIGLTSKIQASLSIPENSKEITKTFSMINSPDIPFVPRKVASWWNTLEDLLWSQKKIRDKVKYRAEAFAKANIDTAMNYGFHARFDFSDYFGQMNEYFAFVKEELHKYNIKYIEHYSCNNVQRPRDKDEFGKLHRTQRHHVLLFHDPVAAAHAQYEGYKFQDLCEVDLIDGSRGYALQYQFEAFCHNNPHFLDMHKKYLERLIREVDFDAYEIDDMCDYVGLRACGCKYCRERFKRDYDNVIPDFGDKNFWGDTSKPMLQWGNYENPVFRDWINMKDDIVADHVAMVKEVIGEKPLFTCCSSTGPIILNSISLNLERIADLVDFFMLENVGINVNSVNWTSMDIEALQQKDIAQKRGNSPAIALSYTIYPDGGYLGWALARFWGVANWACTFQHRLFEEDNADAIETEDMIRPFNNWETKNSDLDHYHAEDFTEVRLVYNYYCRINGWRDSKQVEHWTKARAWSKNLVENNIGYRILRYKELEDAELLLKERTPIVLDGLGCVSDKQFSAIKNYLSKGGVAWVSLPFGTHDEKGFKRSVPLSDELKKKRYKNLKIMDSISDSPQVFNDFMGEKAFIPAIKQVSGEKGWIVRIRQYDDKNVIHFMNSKLKAIPHPDVKDIGKNPVIKKIETLVNNNQLEFEINIPSMDFSGLKLFSPELNDETRNISVIKTGKKQLLQVDLSDIIIYAVAQ